MWHARPDGSSFSCPKSNYGIFWRAVRTGKSFHPEGGLPDASRVRPDSQITSFFLSFPMNPISSQSDIWVKSYDQNTQGCPDGLTERPDGQLQPPLQDSAESFHNKAVSGRCCPSVRTVALRLHEITIIRLGASRPWRLTSERLNWCTQFPYMKLDRLDHEGWRPDGWTWYARSCLIEDIVRTGSHIARTVAAVFP
jgi:hypothetical protein